MSKKKKPENNCVTCGKVILPESTYCGECKGEALSNRRHPHGAIYTIAWEGKKLPRYLDNACTEALADLFEEEDEIYIKQNTISIYMRLRKSRGRKRFKRKRIKMHYTGMVSDKQYKYNGEVKEKGGV